MSESPTPAGPRLPLGWLLLAVLVPVAYFGGQWLAKRPIAAAPAADAVAPGNAGSAAVTPESPAPGTPEVNRESFPPEAAPESQGGGGGVTWRTMEAAIAESQRTGKPLLLDFNADWCPPCQRMKHEAFENPEIARAVEAAVVPVSVVDRYRETGQNPPEIDDLQRRFSIEAFPTLVVLSLKNGQFVKSEGYGGPETTRDWIVQNARSVR